MSWPEAVETNAHTSIPVVFAGLSLSLAEVNAFGIAEVRQPIKRGDLDELQDERVVAIIDGELNSDSVLPIAEISRAIERGVRIRGAASLGALRAFETRSSGMEGCGWVYDAYCTGRIAGAEEITVAYEPLSHRPLTVPLVNIRFGLDRLVDGGSVAAADAEFAMSELKRMSLEERDHRRLMRRLSEIFGRSRVKMALSVLTKIDLNIKKRDASLLLQILRHSTQR